MEKPCVSKSSFWGDSARKRPDMSITLFRLATAYVFFWDILSTPFTQSFEREEFQAARTGEKDAEKLGGGLSRCLAKLEPSGKSEAK